MRTNRSHRSGIRWILSKATFTGARSTVFNFTPKQTFGTGFLNAGYLAACIRDNYSYERYAFADTSCCWLPVFEPDAGALGVLGDAILKINQASEGFMGARNIRALTGLKSDTEGE